MPGAGNIAMLYMQPTGPESCRELMDFYFMQTTPTTAEAESIAYLRDVLQPEDIGLCERVQKGLRSRSYHSGRLIAEIDAWQSKRNQSGARINWMFSTDKARTKMARAYPKPSLKES